MSVGGSLRTPTWASSEMAADLFFFSNLASGISNPEQEGVAQKLLLYVSNHATSHTGFAQEIWQSSLGKLCFQNGWFDFASGFLVL